MKQLVLVVLLFSAGISPALAQDTIHLPCEIFEVSPSFQTESSKSRPIHYALLRHANASERITLSNWLKTNTGTEVIFIVDGKRHPGVLCRMAHCFGRGLLIFTAPVKVKPRDIIGLILPAPSK